MTVENMNGVSPVDLDDKGLRLVDVGLTVGNSKTAVDILI